MFKRFWLFCVLVLIIMGLTAVPAFSLESPDILVDGVAIRLDVQPQVIDGRTVVPIRGVVESMGGDVKWDPSTRSVKISNDDTNILLVVGSNKASVNGEQKILDVPAVVVQGRTLIPVRFVSENLGADVDWDPVQRTVEITTPQEIDEEALNFVIESYPKNMEVKQAKADIKGSLYVNGTILEEPLDFRIDVAGTIKSDLNEPAFLTDLNFTFIENEVESKFPFKMVYKDEKVYFKNPFTLEWEVQDTTDVPGMNVEEMLEFSSSNKVLELYQQMMVEGKENGIFRKVVFLEDKNISGVDTQGVYCSFNGLKLEQFIMEFTKEILMANDPELDEKNLERELEMVMEAIAIDKINITYWIGTEDNLIRSEEGEIRIKIDIEGDHVVADFNFEINLTDINEPQNIKAPEVTQVQ